VPSALVDASTHMLRASTTVHLDRGEVLVTIPGAVDENNDRGLRGEHTVRAWSDP
jgi:hypothetical protein